MVIAPSASAKDSKRIEADLARQLGRSVQVLLDPSAGSAGAQRAELEQASAAAAAEEAETVSIARLVALAAGVSPDDVTIDSDHRRATATAAPLPDAAAEACRVLEQRAAAAASGWQIAIVPPLGRLATIRFADTVDPLDPAAPEAVLLSAREARRWNIPALAVPGLPDEDAPPAKPTLNQRRGLAVAALLRQQRVVAVPAPAAGQVFALTAASGAVR